jgi:hypothetical protein
MKYLQRAIWHGILQGFQHLRRVQIEAAAVKEDRGPQRWTPFFGQKTALP